MSYDDLTGKRFGRLLVLHRTPHVPKQKPRWVCQCDCGVLRIVYGYSMRRGQSTSCGCAQREGMSRRRTTHGQRQRAADTAPGDDARVLKGGTAYATWTSMRSRCRNPNAAGYPNYGGRGIKICPQWDTFEGFLADMGVRPAGMSLDRVDVNGDYTPENCRWATHTQQMRNRRTTLTDAQRRQIAAYLDGGAHVSHTAIAQDFDVSPRTVRRVLQEARRAARK